jgi:hypothetical protein
MKIALHLSGRLKFTDFTLNSMMNCIIAPLKPDVFCSFWHPENPDTATAYQQYLKPILCEFEEQSIMRPYIDSLFRMDKIYPNLPSMAYKFHRVSMVRQMYERATGTKYDVVIQARSDNSFFETFDLQRCQLAVDQQAVLMTNFFQPAIDPYIQPTIRDNFYLGPPELVDRANTEFWYLRDQINAWVDRGNMDYQMACTEIIQSKVWKNLGIKVGPLPGGNQWGHFAFDIDRRDTPWK